MGVHPTNIDNNRFWYTPICNIIPVVESLGRYIGLAQILFWRRSVYPVGHSWHPVTMRMQRVVGGRWTTPCLGPTKICNVIYLNTFSEDAVFVQRCRCPSRGPKHWPVWNGPRKTRVKVLDICWVSCVQVFRSRTWFFHAQIWKNRSDAIAGTHELQMLLSFFNFHIHATKSSFWLIFASQ